MSRAMFNLKPCPFCGSREVHVEISCQGKEGEALRGTTWYYVACKECESSGSATAEREDALIHWNKRIGEDAN